MWSRSPLTLLGFATGSMADLLTTGSSLMQKLGQAPEEVVVIGVEPEEIDWGLELSPNLQKRIPRIIEVILEEIGLTHVSKPEKGA